MTETTSDLCHVVYSLRRRADLSPEEFSTYWRDVHGPLVAARAPLLGIKKYVQRRPVDPAAYAAMTASRQMPEPFDGIAELWVERTALSEALSRAGRVAAREVLEDEARFIDIAASSILVTDDCEVMLP